MKLYFARGSKRKRIYKIYTDNVQKTAAGVILLKDPVTKLVYIAVR